MTHDIRLWLYPGANPDSSAAGWGLEEDISAYIRRPGQDGGQAIQYSGGKGDEAPSVDAGQMTLTLDNRDGRFSTDNVGGPYYGLLDINNPVRMGVVSFADNFTRTASVSGWGGPDTAAGKVWTHSAPATNWTTDGTKGSVVIAAANTAAVAAASLGGGRDMDVTMTVTPVAVATGQRFAAGIRIRTDTTNGHHLTALLSFGLLGAMRMEIIRFAGVSVVTLVDVNPLPSSTYSAGQAWKLRYQVVGQELRAKAWPAAGAEPATWHAEATDDGSIIKGTELGIYTARYSGNTNSGVTPIMTFDDFTATALEFTGSVVSWPLRWDRSGNNSWAPITAAGILRRIRQGTYPIQSPLRRQLAATANVTGYWPMEDGPAVTGFSSTIPGQFAATFGGVTPAQANDLAGGGPAPTLDSATGFITGETGKTLLGTGFSAMVLFKLGSVPTTKTLIIRIRTMRGSVRRWDFSVSDTTLWTEGLNEDGTVITSAVNSHGEDLSKWHAFCLETNRTTTPGQTDWMTTLHAVGSLNYGGQSGSTPGAFDSAAQSFYVTGPAGSAFAHAWLGLNTLPFVTTSFSLVSNGYAGELAADRFARVCTEAGIPYILRPGASEAMGSQKEAGTLAVLESCVEADYGVMAERGSGLEYIPREARWNAAVAMAITVAAGQVADAPEPVRDDQRLRNKWTVSRTNGGQGVYQDDADIARHGIWEDSATINTYDDSVLENHAGFRTALGIVERLRWPSVSLNLARNPSLLPSWRSRTYGWRLAITTGKAQVQGNEPDLIVEGFTASLDPDNWSVVLNCSSAAAWKAAVTDDTGILGRADNEYCETTALVSSTTLSIPITTTSGTRWDNTAGLWTGGVDFFVGGERVTVTSITNGTNPAQTLNCSARGVGGYAASHASGTKVRLWDPPIAAL
jgi:hypothetical protein